MARAQDKLVSVTTEKVRIALISLLTLIALAAVSRFIGVTESPPGFYRDEAAISAQVICIRQSGEDLLQTKHPLFARVLAGGYLTPTYLYPAMAWTSVFGDSIQSFREFTAAFSLLFIFGSFALGARVWRSKEAGLLCALSAALSPWVFQFARIAWDPSIAPAYTVWAFALLWGRKNWELALSGVFFSFAAYCYPPLRVQLAIMMPFAIIGLARARGDWRPYVIPVVTATLVSLPLLILVFSADFQKRSVILSVFNSEFLVREFGDSSITHSFVMIARNFVSLLSPGYLFAYGDENLRHSTSLTGIWSWLDIFAISIAVTEGARALAIREKLSAPSFEVVFVVAGYFAGLLPSALTWEGNPHALRSFGSAVFLVLGVGGILASSWTRSKTMRALIIAISAIWVLNFYNAYFVRYPKLAEVAFDRAIPDGAKTLRQEGRITQLPDVIESHGIYYEPMATQYYILAAGAERCPIKKKPEKN